MVMLLLEGAVDVAESCASLAVVMGLKWERLQFVLDR